MQPTFFVYQRYCSNCIYERLTRGIYVRRRISLNWQNYLVQISGSFQVQLPYSLLCVLKFVCKNCVNLLIQFNSRKGVILLRFQASHLLLMLTTHLTWTTHNMDTFNNVFMYGYPTKTTMNKMRQTHQRVLHLQLHIESQRTPLADSLEARQQVLMVCRQKTVCRQIFKYSTTVNVQTNLDQQK